MRPVQSRPPLLATLLVGLQLSGYLLPVLLVSGAYQTQTSSTHTSTTSITLLRSSRIRRPESCRESLPRKSDDLPALVVTGRVKEVYLASDVSLTINTNTNQPAAPAPATITTTTSPPVQDPKANKALFNIGRVIKGNKQLLGTDIVISGFNTSNSAPCPNYVKPNDTLILLLNQDGDRKYSIQGGNLLSMSLNNLDRINSIAADEPFKRRGPIEDILCEAHYCAYGRCVANEYNQTSCHCPDSCPPLPAPVCGSDNNTYSNECHLIKEGCRIQKPLFVTKEASC